MPIENENVLLPEKNKKHFQKLTVLRYDINKEGIAYEG